MCICEYKVRVRTHSSWQVSRGRYPVLGQPHPRERIRREADAPAREWSWAVLRLLLSFLQVTGASLGIGLLFNTGVTRLALTVVIVTGLFTTLSVLLFGGRNARRESAPRRRR